MTSYRALFFIGLATQCLACDSSGTTSAEPSHAVLKDAAPAASQPQASSVVEEPNGPPVEVIENEPPLTAADLKKIKGNAMYFFKDDGQPAIRDWGGNAEANETTLVVVKAPGRGMAQLALVKKSATGLLPMITAGGPLPEGDVWVTPVPIAFGGAVWDGGAHVLFTELHLGPVLDTRGNGLVEKVRLDSTTLNLATRRADGSFAHPLSLVRGQFGKKKTRVLTFHDAAIWPQSVAAEGALLELSFAVDSLVEPLYAGADRDERDGFYSATFALTGIGAKVVAAPKRVGPMGLSIPQPQDLPDNPEP